MKVLIVEDDPMVRTIINSFLKKVDQNFTTYEVSDLPTAQDILEKEKIDLLLLDVYLGSYKGPDLLKWVRESSIDIDVVLITADNSAETVENSFRLGAVDYLIKPFNFARFNEAIQSVLHRKDQLKTHDAVDQDRIDSFVKQQKTDSRLRSIEKGINPMTQQIIIDTLRESNKPLTSHEIADITSLARVTVRRYLVYFLEEGLVDEQLKYGKVGRPQKCYKLI